MSQQGICFIWLIIACYIEVHLILQTKQLKSIFPQKLYISINGHMHIIRHTHIKFTRIWWGYVTRVREAHWIYISIEKNDLWYILERNFLALKKSRVFSLFPSLWKEQNSYSGEQPQLCITYASSPSNTALLSQCVCFLDYFQFSFSNIRSYYATNMLFFNISSPLSLFFLTLIQHYIKITKHKMI